MKRGSLALFTVFSIGLFFLPGVTPVFAQEGPCSTDGTCPADQVCLGDRGGNQCFRTCTIVSEVGAPPGECGTDSSCYTVPDIASNVCIGIATSFTVDFTALGSSISACSDSRPCTSPPVCMEGTCRIPDGSICSTSEQCRVGSGCVDTGSRGKTCVGGATAPSTGSSGSPGAAPEAPFTPITPELGVPIPGVTLSAPTQDAGNVSVPFLIEYINGVYRYLVGIVLVVAVVMVVYGGFRYLVGAGVGGVERGKEIIRDAIAGMLLILGAYVILQTVNPATTSFNALSLTSASNANLILEGLGGALQGVEATGGGVVHDESYSGLDDLFQQYAPCAGVDWRVLKAIATIESGLNPAVVNRFGCVGLFQFCIRNHPENCPFTGTSRAADCQNLTDPRINIEAAVTGQIKTAVNRIRTTCPQVTDATRLLQFIYFGHNSGSGLLRLVLNRVGCNGTVEQYDQAAARYWEKQVADGHRPSPPPNYDRRMAEAASRVARVALGLGVTNPFDTSGSCPLR